MSFSLKNAKPEQAELQETAKKKKHSFFGKEPKAIEEERVSVSGKKITKKEKKQEETSRLNPMLLNMMSPMGIAFKQSSLTIGEAIAGMFGAVKYPEKVEYGWLSGITNLSSSIVGISFQSVPSGELLGVLNHSINQNRRKEAESTNHAEIEDAKSMVENASKLYREISKENQKTGMMSLTVMPYAYEEDAYQKGVEKVKAAMRDKNIISRNMAFFQKQCFKLLSPFYARNEEACEYLDRLIPLSVLIGGFPFASSGFHDKSGVYFAKDTAGGLVVLDIWKRGEDRTNSNMIFLGSSGAGKSTAVKHMILSQFMRGVKIFILDPEGEYRDMVRLLGGDIIEAGGGKNGILNILQIRPMPKTLDLKEINTEKEIIYPEGWGDMEDETEQMPDLASYLNWLETFFEIYLKDATVAQLAVLKSTIIELYERTGITWDTNVRNLSNEDFPVVKDLWDLIEEKKEATVDSLRKEIYQNLSIALEDMASGADSFIWNGKTNIRYNSNIVCFDTKAMAGFSKKKKAAQYYNIMGYLWQEVIADRKEEVMIIADEVYLALDKDVPQTANSLRDMVKRVRKYEGSLVLISHLVSEFLSPELRLLTQPLLDIPTYKILMGTDGQNLADIKALYKLNEAEEQLLEEQKRGQALAIMGNNHLRVQFEIPSYKFDYFGEGSGR